MKRIAVVMVVVVGSFGCGGANEESAPAAAKAAPVAAEEVGYDVRRLRPRDGETLEERFDEMRVEAVKEGKHVAVLFSADWCEPCRDLALELGNTHPPEKIGSFRVLELVEEDWEKATRIGDFNNLRRRWYAPVGSYPVFVVLDERGGKIEEMKEAIARLEAAGVEATVPNWFADIAAGGGPKASGS